MAPMTEGMRPPRANSDGRRLNGWKEIASYFDRSVRTVQRWEAEQHLPIRRLGMGRSEVVTALVSDLERWRKTAEAETARQATEPGNGGGLSAGGAVDGAAAPALGATTPPGGLDPALSSQDALRSRWWRRPYVAGTLLALTLVAAGAWWMWAGMPGSKAGEPYSTKPRDKVLTVRDAGGNVLWEHRFTELLGLETAKYAIADLDADGHQEVLAIAGMGASSPGAARLYCFDRRGKTLWTFKCTKSQTFGDVVYAPPFVPEQLSLSDAPNGKKYIWLVSNHVPWFPSVVHKLTASGSVLGEFWSAGYVTVVQTANWDGRKVVVIGARNNENGSASLALLDEDRPNGAAPAAKARYQCRTCPAGAPLAFVIFSQPERFAQLSGTALVDSIQADVNGSIVAWVDLAADFGGSTVAFFTLDRQLRLVRADTADTFETICQAMVKRGLIPPFAPGAGLEQLRTALWWNGRAFEKLVAPRGPDRPAK
jgi:hypothetical protein